MTDFGKFGKVKKKGVRTKPKEKHDTFATCLLITLLVLFAVMFIPGVIIMNLGG